LRGGEAKMILSGRDIVRFILFIALVGLVAFYVTGNLDDLMENTPFASSDEGSEAGSGGRPGDGGDASPSTGDSAGPAQTQGEAVPVFSFAPEVLQGEGAGAGPPPAAGDLFTEFRLERERARSLQLDLLREVLDDPGIEGQAREQAVNLWLEITRSVTLETDIENLIRAKDFEDAVVVLSGGKATVLVKAAQLTEEEVVRIADIVVRVAGLSYEDIAVLAREG